MENHSMDFSRAYRQALNLLTRGEWTEAIGSFSTLATVSPEDPGIQVGLGWCLLSADRHAEAEASFRRGLTREPRNVTAILGLSLSLLRMGDYFEAAGQIEHGLKLEPCHPEFLLARVAALLGTGRRKAASHLVRRLLAEDIDLGRSLSKLGRSLFDSGQFTHAAEIARICLRHRPKDAELLALLGASEIRDGQVDAGAKSRDRSHRGACVTRARPSAAHRGHPRTAPGLKTPAQRRLIFEKAPCRASATGFQWRGSLTGLPAAIHAGPGFVAAFSTGTPGAGGHQDRW
jgi:Flp pilus assembly protein TadD